MDPIIIVIPWRLPGFNEIIEAAHKNIPWLSHGKVKVTQYVQMKKEWSQRIALIFQEAKVPALKSVFVTFTWVEKNKQRDPDNIAAAKKFIFDGMVLAGVLENDGWSQNLGWKHRFKVGPNEGVIVRIGDE